MNEYVKYLLRVWDELRKLPTDEFNRRMEEISPCSTTQFISEFPSQWLDEPIVYYEPSPRTYMKVLEAFEKIDE